MLLLLSAYIGLLPHDKPKPKDGAHPPSSLPSDKLLHLGNFFLISIAFYWIVDTSRRRTLHLTIVVCTIVLGIGSEILQALLPNDRSFDPFDVLANVVGSLVAVGLCTWYHKRMLDRRRKARFGALLDGAGEDVELGLNSAEGEGEPIPQESGVTATRSLEQEVDNWDENAVDNWDEEGDEDQTGTSGDGDVQKTPPSSTGNGDTEDRRPRHD